MTTLGCTTHPGIHQHDLQLYTQINLLMHSILPLSNLPGKKSHKAPHGSVYYNEKVACIKCTLMNSKISCNKCPWHSLY